MSTDTSQPIEALRAEEVPGRGFRITARVGGEEGSLMLTYHGAAGIISNAVEQMSAGCVAHAAKLAEVRKWAEDAAVATGTTLGDTAAWILDLLDREVVP